jgi:Ser/Thr protein kinase RdoA (MazF antagonist)
VSAAELHAAVGDSEAELALQDAVLEHLARSSSAPLAPRLLPTLAGERSARVETGDGPRVVRLLTWLEGCPLAEAMPLDEPKRAVAKEVFDRYAEEVAPRLAALPHQVIHNDANEQNVLVDDAGRLSGLVDFGDVVWSARVCGLAVAAAYAMAHREDPVGAVAPLVHGYDQVGRAAGARRGKPRPSLSTRRRPGDPGIPLRAEDQAADGG